MYAKPEESYNQLEILTNFAEEILKEEGINAKVINIHTICLTSLIFRLIWCPVLPREKLIFGIWSN
jgi:hypothetical protein